MDENDKHNMLVCCLDILGFSNKTDALEIEQLVEIYDNIIIGAVKDATHSFKNYTGEEPSFSQRRTECVWFSDTVVLYGKAPQATHGNSSPEYYGYCKDEVRGFLQSAKILFLHLLFNGYPSRGGIDVGPFYADAPKGIYVGKALIEAYKLCVVHQWAGISLTDRCSTFLLDRLPAPEEFLVDYKVPSKSGKSVNRKVINWPLDKSMEDKNVTTYIRQKFEFPDCQLDTDAKKKLENTLKFCKHVRQHDLPKQ